MMTQRDDSDRRNHSISIIMMIKFYINEKMKTPDNPIIIVEDFQYYDFSIFSKKKLS